MSFELRLHPFPLCAKEFKHLNAKKVTTQDHKMLAFKINNITTQIAEPEKSTGRYLEILAFFACDVYRYFKVNYKDGDVAY